MMSHWGSPQLDVGNLLDSLPRSFRPRHFVDSDTFVDLRPSVFCKFAVFDSLAFPETREGLLVSNGQTQLPAKPHDQR